MEVDGRACESIPYLSCNYFPAAFTILPRGFKFSQTEMSVSVFAEHEMCCLIPRRDIEVVLAALLQSFRFSLSDLFLFLSSIPRVYSAVLHVQCTPF